MNDYQQRVIKEKEELDVNWQKLLDFFSTSTYKALSTEEQVLLNDQSELMVKLSNVLGKRIDLFKRGPDE